ncbi:MAG: hypothetical protein IJ764_00380 [Bacteroidales bacterium]|nr:hypothetical protein [Bacteroidales bacterium]
MALSDSIAYTRTNLQPRRKTAIITLKRSELIYDIQNRAMLVARGFDSGDNFKDISLMQPGDDENDLDMLARSLNTAFDDIAEALFAFCKTSAEDGTERDDSISLPESYILQLTIPDDYSDTSVRRLVNIMHEYMVCLALADWLTATYPAAAEQWIVRKDQAINNLRRTVQKRIRRVRRTMSPL